MVNRHKLGLVFAACMGLSHFLWAWLVLTGMAQTVINWIFRLHFIEPPYVIGSFDLGVAISLVIITTAIGYLSGWTLAAIWNWLRTDYRRKPFPNLSARHHPAGH
jgi:hypothetical protein